MQYDDGIKTWASPEELLLRDLVILAVTIRDDRQVNSLTLVNATKGYILIIYGSTALNGGDAFCAENTCFRPQFCIFSPP